MPPLFWYASKSNIHWWYRTKIQNRFLVYLYLFFVNLNKYQFKKTWTVRNRTTQKKGGMILVIVHSKCRLVSTCFGVWLYSIAAPVEDSWRNSWKLETSSIIAVIIGTTCKCHPIWLRHDYHQVSQCDASYYIVAVIICWDYRQHRQRIKSINIHMLSASISWTEPQTIMNIN